MARPPLPAALTGAFFVLAYDRIRECLVLYLDDIDRSSYRLGTVAEAAFQFKLWGQPEFGLRAVDQAREFGMVQAIPSQNRIINLIPRNVKRSPVFTEEGSRSHYVEAIPI